LHGVLVADANGTPVGFQVGMDRVPTRRLEIDDVGGKFEFQGLEAGEHTITWSRPAHRWSLDGDSREQTIHLAAGEVREITLDAASSKPCDVIIYLSSGGRPAAGAAVNARVRPRTKSGLPMSFSFGTSGADGMVKGQVDGDLTFDIDVITASLHRLGTVEEDLRASPGGRIERTVDISTGRLLIELPAGVQVEKYGQIQVYLARNEPGPRVPVVRTAEPRPHVPGAPVWTTSRIDFGEFRADSYDVLITCMRLDSSGERVKVIQLHEPFRTKVVIEADREVKLVVP
jgi:hypothetical protein